MKNFLHLHKALLDILFWNDLDHLVSYHWVPDGLHRTISILRCPNGSRSHSSWKWPYSWVRATDLGWIRQWLRGLNLQRGPEVTRELLMAVTRTGWCGWMLNGAGSISFSGAEMWEDDGNEAELPLSSAEWGVPLTWEDWGGGWVWRIWTETCITQLRKEESSGGPISITQTLPKPISNSTQSAIWLCHCSYLSVYYWVSVTSLLQCIMILKSMCMS